MKTKNFLLCALMAVCTACALNAQTYTVVQTGTEYRFYYAEQHFMTLLTNQGIHAFRPHPGLDVNGWGSTWYAQPFLPGAVLANSVIDSVKATNQGIDCYAHGKVSMNQTQTYGDWIMQTHFAFTPESKKIIGTGLYTIALDDHLSSSTGDLNLYKLASNYMFDVPLLCSPYFGTTGDMQQAVFDGNTYTGPVEWVPETGDLWIWQYADSLQVDLWGNYNSVDTEEQGYAPIEPAYKPGMKITLNSLDAPGLEMINGAIFNQQQGQEFWSDNCGLTPVVLKISQRTEFHYSIDFESQVPVEQAETSLILPDIPEFQDSLEVSIACNTPDSEIRYTLDGSEPKINSLLYSQPFMIYSTLTVKAKAYACGLETGQVAEKEYEINNSTIIYPSASGGISFHFSDGYDVLYLRSDFMEADSYQIIISDLQGRRLMNHEIRHKGGALETEIGFTLNKKGICLISVKGSRQFNCTRKVILP